MIRRRSSPFKKTAATKQPSIAVRERFISEFRTERILCSLGTEGYRPEKNAIEIL